MLVMGRYTLSVIFITLLFIEIVCGQKPRHTMRPTIHIHGGYPLIQMNQGTAVGHIGSGHGLRRTLGAAGIGTPGHGTPGHGTPGSMGTPSIGSPGFGLGGLRGSTTGMMGHAMHGEYAAEMIEALGESMLFPGMGATSTQMGASAMNTGQQGQLSNYLKMMANGAGAGVSTNHQQRSMGEFSMNPTFANGLRRSWKPSHFIGSGQLITDRGGRGQGMKTFNGNTGIGATAMSDMANNWGQGQMQSHRTGSTITKTSQLQHTVGTNGNSVPGMTALGQLGGTQANSLTATSEFGETGTHEGAGQTGLNAGYNAPGYATVETNGNTFHPVTTRNTHQMGDNWGNIHRFSGMMGDGMIGTNELKDTGNNTSN